MIITAPAAANAIPTGWDASETASRIIAARSPRRSRRSSASIIPSPAARAICDGIRTGVITTSDPAPKNSIRSVGGMAKRSGSQRRRRRNRRPAESSTSRMPMTRYAR